MTEVRSTWLTAWDQADLEWQRLEVVALSALFLGLLLVVLLRLVLTVFGASVPDATGELIRAAALWLIMLSASLACAEGRPELGAERLSQKRPYWFLIISFAAAMASLLLMSAALRFLLFDLHLGARPVLGVSMGWWILPMPLLFLVMALRFLRRSVGEFGN